MFEFLFGGRSRRYAEMGVEEAVHVWEGKWKRALRSGQGLFEQHDVDNQIIGPHFIPDENKIAGDMFSTESMLFAQVATERQQELADRLMETYKERYYQYVLHVIQGLKIWQRDIGNLQHMEKFLTSMEKVLNKEKDLEEHEKSYYSEMTRIHEGFKKFFRHQLKATRTDLDRDFEQVKDDIEEFGNHLQESLRKIEAKKETIDKHLKRYKKEMPFLFS